MLVTACAALMLCATAYASGDEWSAPTYVTNPLVGEDGLPSLAVGPDGSAITAWEHHGTLESTVRFAQRPAGGGFSAPADLVTPGAAFNGYGVNLPQVAVNASGEAVAAWLFTDGSNYRVYAAVRPAGSTTFGTPAPLSAAGQNAASPDVAIGPTGNAVVVWSRYDGSRWHAQAASRAGGGAFDAAVPLSATGVGTGTIFASAPRVAIDAQGAATAVFEAGQTVGQPIQWSSKALNGAFGAPANLSPAGEAAFLPQIAVSPAGAAVAVWQLSTDYSIQAATRPAGGGFGAAKTISATGNSYTPQVAISGAGEAVITYENNATADSTIHLVTHPDGGAFTTPVPLSDSGQDAGESHIAVNAAGAAAITWSRFDGTKSVVQSVTRPAGGTFGAVQNISNVSGPNSGAADKSDVALDAAGNATAVWRASNGFFYLVKTATHAADGSVAQPPPAPTPTTPAAVVPAPSPAALPPADATPKSVAAAVKLAAATLTVAKDGSLATPRVTCQEASTGVCTATVRFSTRTKKPVLIGSVTFKVRGGTSAAAKLKLNRKGKALLAKTSRLAVTALVTVKDASGNQRKFTLKQSLKPAPKKRAR